MIEIHACLKSAILCFRYATERKNLQGEKMIRGIRRPKVARGRAWVSNIVACSLIVASLQNAGVLGAEPANGFAASSTPKTVAELTELEARVRNAIRLGIPAIVAIDVPTSRSAEDKRRHLNETQFEGFASGVIIRGDGLILSQWHVSHQTSVDVWREPGDQVEVVLQDGRRLKAELLGADPVRDLSLLRIIEPGEYPHARLASEHAVAVGDWVLKLGHPLATAQTAARSLGWDESFIWEMPSKLSPTPW